MKIAVGSDHRGFEAKEMVKSIVTQMGYEFSDMGTTDNRPMDYPDIAYRVAIGVSKGEVDRGILICSTGIGMCIAANKVNGVRAALCHDEFTAGVSRVHNDSNVLCFGADQSGEVMLRKMVETWLSSNFSIGRHERRVAKIQAIEKGLDPQQA